MKNTLLIRIPPLVSTIDAETAVQWATFSGGGELQGDVHISEIGKIKEQWLALQDEKSVTDKIAERPIQETLVLLLPGNLAICRRLELNSGQRKHIHSALPYLIEEELAQDIESFHIAHHLHRKSSEVTLVAIPHASIQEILSVFERSGLPLNSIYAECQLLSVAPETALLVLDSNMVMMATPGTEALAIDYDAVPFALNQRATAAEENTVLLQTETPGRLSQVKLAYASGAIPTPDNRVDSVRQGLAQQGWLLEEEVFSGSIFELFVQRYFETRKSSRLVDLRQGSYQCPKKASRQIKQWRPLIAIAACWLLLEIGLMIGQGIYFGQKAGELWNQNADSYLRVFPQDRQVKDARSRGLRTFDLQRWMQNRLKNLGQNPEGEPFLPLLQKISVVASAQGADADLVPQAMDFNDSSGHLVFEFQAANLEVVNKFMDALRAGGLQTRLDSANQDKAGVIARMTVARESRG